MHLDSIAGTEDEAPAPSYLRYLRPAKEPHWFHGVAVYLVTFLLMILIGQAVGKLLLS